MKNRKILSLTVLLMLLSLTALWPFRYEIRLLYNLTIQSPSNVDEINKNSVWGLDISHYQGEVEWPKFNSFNIPDFVFIKATEGKTYKDEKYKDYKINFQNKGVPVGAYHFFTITSSGEDQAKEFIRFAGLKKGDLFPVLDFEIECEDSKEYVITQIKSYITTIENHYGVKPIIYCNYDLAVEYIPDINNMVIWAADYHFEPNCNYTFWQQTSEFRHSSFSTNVDFNTFNIEEYKLSNYIIR